MQCREQIIRRHLCSCLKSWLEWDGSPGGGGGAGSEDTGGRDSKSQREYCVLIICGACSE